ncbi:MAG: aminomethyltransferase family protein, partial [Rhodobacter sp.]|nr:aminomethyltransferase family protein [Rhodobacter sp.]
LDLPGFSRFHLSGPGATDWLLGRTAGGLPRDGRIGLAYFPDDRGRIVTEMSVACNGPDDYTLITAAAAQWHDREWLECSLPGHLTLRDRTADLSTLIVTGPKSRDLFAAISNADLTLPWLSHETSQVAGQNAVLARVSFAGELGWEVHASPQTMPAIYDAVLAQRAKPFGMWALDRLRLEKGYRAWKGDLSTDYSLLEGGLDRFIRFDKPQDFPGKAALLAEKQQGVKKRFATLIIEAGDQDPPYMSTVWHGDIVVGEITSGGWGYRVNACIGLAMIRADLAAEGSVLEVEIFGTRYSATVQADQPLWDPKNERLRA